ncbi:hypothetical protein [Croceicoccus pelagius]|uniref:Uncharacterized protein n=1 Tax=Croceicoccus pelagius TaxID=1703341 RepID=A0A917DEJ9_9SPHN|nr:hypothetical protein [Croceicoccus pelagius]GGD31802.1 hypothetical protein GCM10010989_02330 [Croceicoccus pelagius]
MGRWFLAALALIGQLQAVPVQAAPEAVSVHSGWGAFRDGDRCYAIAQAEPSPYARERQPFASVVVSPGEPRLTLRLSRTLARDAVITLDVGNRRFRLAGGGDSAWARDAADHAAVLAAMRSRDTMTVGARDANGRFFRDAYKLAGAPTAMDAAIIACRP